MPSFPDSRWFLTLGQLMQAEGELFRRLGYAETRFAVRVVPNNMGNGGDQIVGLVIDGYQLTEAKPVEDLNEYDVMAAGMHIMARRSVLFASRLAAKLSRAAPLQYPWRTN